MLSKLLKHEFRNSWRIALIFNVAGIALAFAVMLIIRVYAGIDDSGFGTRGYVLNEWNDLFRVLSGSFIVMYLVFMIVANAIMFLFLAMRFYREIYSDTGYMMHALPVSKGQLLRAHLICSALWLFEFIILDAVCFLIAIGGIPGSYAQIGEAFRTVREGWTLLAHQYPEMNGYLNLLIVLGILRCLIQPFMTMLQTYCAISLGQTFKTHRVVGAFVMYFVISVIGNTIAQSLNYIFISGSLRKVIDPGVVYESMAVTLEMIRMWNIMLAGMVVIGVLFSVVFYVITRYRMMYKLDLE